MKTEHISVTRSKKSIANLDARIAEMTAIVRSGTVPNDFDIYKSDDRIAKWDDSSLGISKITVRIARDNYPLKWLEIQNLKASIKKMIQETDKKKVAKVSKSKKHVILQNQKSKRTISNLTNELIMLRAAYMDLIKAAGEDKHKNKVFMDTIKRHHAHHGLQRIVGNAK